MTSIDPRTRSRIANAVRKVEQSDGTGLALPSAPGGYPVLLARTTTTHNQGTTEQVEFLYGPKGSEVPSGETQPAYNRFANLAEGEDCLVRWIDQGWEIISSRRATLDPGVSVECGHCITLAGDLTVTVEGIAAAPKYRADLFCTSDGGLLTFLASAEMDGWQPVSVEVGCTDGDITFDVVLGVTSAAPGGVTITATGGAYQFVWDSFTAWQPGQNLWLRLVSYTADCPCLPIKSLVCLAPQN